MMEASIKESSGQLESTTHRSSRQPHYASSIGSTDDLEWTPSTGTSPETEPVMDFTSQLPVDLQLYPTSRSTTLKLVLDTAAAEPTISPPKSPLYQENEYLYYQPKRSSSLKTKRTPPESPGHKMVRFADAFGLDLETVRTVFNQESPPKIPDSAIWDLHLDNEEEDLSAQSELPYFFCTCFPQPGASGNFLHRVMQQNVCLERVHVDSTALNGAIRVRSLGFEKRVHVRLTFNNWRTVSDIPAHYEEGSHDGATDRFTFGIVMPETMAAPGAKCQFAVHYDPCRASGETYWDNNCGQNYIVECIFRDHNGSSAGVGWLS